MYCQKASEVKNSKFPRGECPQTPLDSWRFSSLKPVLQGPGFSALAKATRGWERNSVQSRNCLFGNGGCVYLLCGHAQCTVPSQQRGSLRSSRRIASSIVDLQGKSVLGEILNLIEFKLKLKRLQWDPGTKRLSMLLLNLWHHSVEFRGCRSYLNHHSPPLPRLRLNTEKKW